MKLLLSESKQALINIGFPPVIASVFFKHFGQNNAFTVAKWYKEYKNLSASDNKTWWKRNHHWSSTRSQDINLLIALANAVQVSIEEYNRVRKENELTQIDPARFDPSSETKLLADSVQALLFEDIFFKYNIIRNLIKGKLKDLTPYKDLDFTKANNKYEAKIIFDDKQPIKIYRDGWKWIDAGNKCNLVGGMMKNCGSTGVMSLDPNSTMLTLFDKNNIPHVVVTYSPGENRISGVEGQGSTGIKQEYKKYVVDLVKKLKAVFDISRDSHNPVLKIHYELQGLIKNLKQIYKGTPMQGNPEFFTFKTQDNKQWFASPYVIISKEQVLTLTNKYKKNCC